MNDLIPAAVFSAAIACAICCRAEDITMDFVDVVYQAHIKEDELAKWPDWDETHGNPLVSPRKALSLANDAFSRLRIAKDLGDWVIDRPQMDLFRFRGQRWVWMITYSAWPKRRILDDVPPSIGFIVRMDGVVVTVEKTDAPSYYATLAVNKLPVAKKDTTQQSLQSQFKHFPREFCDRSIILHGTKARPATFCSTVTQEVLDTAPHWSVDAAYPPLSASAALIAANAAARECTGPLEVDHWALFLEGLSLQELADNEWVWVVKYTAGLSPGGGTGVPPELRVIVLMNGKVVPLMERR